MILMKKVDFRVLPRGVPTERHNLVSSLEYLVSNGRQVLLGGIRLGDSATLVSLAKALPFIFIIDSSSL